MKRIGRNKTTMSWIFASALMCLGCLPHGPRVEAPAPAPQVTCPRQETFLLTILLKHDQSMTLDEIAAELNSRQFWQVFPPPGTEVVSWYVMMGIGHVVTLRVPPALLRDVNLAIERNAWKAFRTEFYPTYDYMSTWRERTQQEQQQPSR